MTYILYYSRGGKQKLDNVAEVYENRSQVRFIFTNGLELNVIKRYLLHYEPYDVEVTESRESVQEVFNRFDDFVDQFVCKVEESVNRKSKYSIKVDEIKNFQAIMGNYKTSNVVEALHMKP